MGKLGDFEGLAAGVGTLGDQGLVSGLVAVVEAENAVCAARLASLAEIERRGLAKELGATETKRWWARSVNITDGKAAFEVALGVWLSEHPLVLAAMASGALARDHAAAVRDGVVLVAAADPELDIAEVEAELLELALVSKIADVGRRAEAIAQPARAAKYQREQKKYEQEKAARAEREKAEREKAERERLDEERRTQANGDPNPTPEPEPTPKPEPDPEPTPPVPPVPPAEDTSLNWLSLFVLPNGRYEWRGEFDKFSTEEMRTRLQPLTAPQPGPNGERDDRSTARRNADALALLLAEGGFGSSIVTTLLTVSLADLTGHTGSGCPDAQGQWPFDLSWTGPVSEQLARLITCDGDLAPIIVDGAGVPLAMGDLVRLATETQRLAVFARDRCCVGCGRPKEFCQVHHIRHWADGGASDVSNYALLCPDCHRLVHHRGWEVVMGEDGHPWMIPPVSVDPARSPIPSYHRRQRRRTG